MTLVTHTPGSAATTAADLGAVGAAGWPCPRAGAGAGR